LQITRASHVEPDRDGFWWADMGPVDGPVLGPFKRRSDALASERFWLLYSSDSHTAARPPHHLSGPEFPFCGSTPAVP